MVGHAVKGSGLSPALGRASSSRSGEDTNASFVMSKSLRLLMMVVVDDLKESWLTFSDLESAEL